MTKTVRAFAAAGLLASPVLSAVWLLPLFVTQDGPAHLHTGYLLAQLTAGDGWIAAQTYLQDYPLPNLLAQIILAALTPFFPGRIADQILMSLTFAGLAAAVVWLRVVVRGTQGIWALLPFAIVVSLSRLWLLGLYGFILGAAIFCVVLGWWWRTREEPSLRWSAILAMLLLVAWFSHLVSYIFTVIALGILLTSVPRVSRRSVNYTLLAFVPSFLLAGWYATVMAGHASFVPYYMRLKEHSVGGWLQYLRSVKVLSIAPQTALPFLDDELGVFALFAPAVLLGIAFTVCLISTVKALRTHFSDLSSARAWAIIAAVFLVGSLIAPESFGPHGGFLRERIFLLGLISAVPAISLPSAGSARAVLVLTLLALVLQSAFVWEYAIESNQRLGGLTAAASVIPASSRVLVIQPRVKERFRVSPTLHAANLLGARPRVVVWNNFQANIYYFPVNFKQPFRLCSEDGSCEIRENRNRIDLVVLWPPTTRSVASIGEFFPRRLLSSPEISVHTRNATWTEP